MKENEFNKTVMELPIGDSMKLNEREEIVITHDGFDQMIDIAMSDVEGKKYITSNGLCEILDIEHKKIVKRYIEPNLFDYVTTTTNRGGAQLGPSSKHTQLMRSVVEKDWFIKSTYVGDNNKTLTNYKISMDGFMYLMINMPRPRDEGKAQMRTYLSAKIVQRYRHLQRLLAKNFQSYLLDVREFGKNSRKHLTDSIKFKIQDTNGEEKELGGIYSFITYLIYRFLFIPKDEHKEGRDRFEEDVIIAILLSESVIASWISSLKMDCKKFDLKFIKDKRYEIQDALSRSLNMVDIKAMVQKNFN